MDPQHLAAFSQVRTSEYLTVEENCDKLNKFITDYEAVKSSLMSLSEKCKHPVMVPFGNVAFMSGSLVHTNDVLVLLGDNWFVEQSAKQTVDILNRRIVALQTEAGKLKTRMQQIKTELSYAKGLAEVSGDTVEIVEPYDEQSEQKWKTQHDENVRRFRQEMKESETSDVNTLAATDGTDYEQIWRRLEQLEKEEEEDDDVEDESDVRPYTESTQQESVCDSEDDDDSDDTPERSRAFVINFKHSTACAQVRERGALVRSPADIYDRYREQSSAGTSHISTAYLHQVEETQHSQSRDVSCETSDIQPCVESHVTGSQRSEILQRSVAADMRSSSGEPTVRKVSKFKASRLKK